MGGNISVSAAFESYCSNEIIMRHGSRKTEESYQNAKKLLIRKFGDIDLSLFTNSHVREWHLWLSTWQAPNTVRNNIICLRMVLCFLARRGYSVIDYNTIPVAKRQKSKIKYLTDEEVDQFIEEVGKPVRGYPKVNRLRNVAIVTLIANTGLRNSEVCAFNRDSIKNRTFTVIGKSRDPRPVFINTKAEEAINAYLAVRTDKNNAMFISPQTGKRITSGTLRRIFEYTCSRSDFEGIHPHTIRHSYATILLERNVDLRYIADLMGHVDLNTTKLYTHLTNPKLRNVYEAAMGA